MRLFVGIPLAPEAVSELAKLVQHIRHEHKSGLAGLRWLPPESWHITLQFLGNTDEAHYNCLIARLAEIRYAEVPLRIEELGAFERAGVVFAGVSITPNLVELAQRVTEATSRCGFVAEERPYHPHITLARAKNRINPLRGVERQAPHRQFSSFVAREFLLYESHTQREGAHYEVRARFSLEDA